MKLTPEEMRIVERMAPGVLAGEGFLGQDRRSLREIIETDNAAVEKANLTHEQIARWLERVLHAAASELGRAVQIDRDHTAVYRESMGPIPCPWGGCGLFPKGEVELVNQRTCKTLHFTPLSVHLIAHHGFYQGRRARYRLEVEDLAELA